MPAYLAIVPLSVQLDTPLKRQAEVALPMLEAIEQRAATQGVPVDSRIEPGRSVRHAFRSLMKHERFDRVVAAGATNGDGFSSDDVAWLLEHAPGEILIFRPSREARKPTMGMRLSGRNGQPKRAPRHGGSTGLPGRSRDQGRDDPVRGVLLRVPEDSEDEVTAGGLDRLDALVVGRPGAGRQRIRDLVYTLVMMGLDCQVLGARGVAAREPGSSLTSCSAQDPGTGLCRSWPRRSGRC